MQLTAALVGEIVGVPDSFIPDSFNATVVCCRKNPAASRGALTSVLALMSKFKAIVVLSLLSLSALASEPVLHWRGLELHEISSLAMLPAPIRQQLAVEASGLRGVADKGEPFNVTDVVDSSKPMRRLLAAGKSDDTWLVALEQGGRGYSVQVYLFSDGAQQQHWALLSRPATLQAVTEQLSVTAPRK